MKKFICISIVSLLLFSCEKEDEAVPVEYRVSNAYSETEISYKSTDEQLLTEVYTFESGEDIWSYSLDLNRGDIVYLSAVYHDSTSSVKLEVLIDGKVYKQGLSNNEPDKYLIVSGTVPY